ncbi:RNA polymerase sigma-70 factor [Marinifilum caeruleilacunae]|uniref:RNA polymerase sigma-70 factor n=1 Tax=Marinifilum caeruleilacunae TaxID=2499076 RepID=A0ABX1WZM0_9BACT|nr:RNA polymerase sigma-70 factor [Marinifilum caeruleilacunae]NOU61309.1 RNA polymerase sigma-70 factor [Marinifilum caeruleilacunae]
MKGQSSTVNLLKDRDLSEGFNVLFNELYVSLVHYANRFIGDLNQSEDIVQEVFINYWIKFGNSNSNNEAKKYLFRSVYNGAIDNIRYKKVEKKRLSRYLYLYNNFCLMNDLALETEISARIENTKISLPKQCRRIFSLSRDDGFTYREIASELDLSVKTVETQMSKALRIFRKQLSIYME